MPSSPIAVRLARRLFSAVWHAQAFDFGLWSDVRGPAIVVANHLSLLDGPLLAAFVPFAMHFAVTQDFADRQPWKFALDALSHAGCGTYSILDAQRPFALRSLYETLKRGGRIAIFPEGCISATGALGPMRPGVVRLALATGAPLLPVRISGTETTRFGKAGSRITAAATSPIVLRARERIATAGRAAAEIRQSLKLALA